MDKFIVLCLKNTCRICDVN
uniref:Uncharacterized protein n=1 Tax=Rhizophora mucronata TaxID=61149 RepID=A0A2P2PU79_RHIMU